MPQRSRERVELGLALSLCHITGSAPRQKRTLGLSTENPFGCDGSEFEGSKAFPRHTPRRRFLFNRPAPATGRGRPLIPGKTQHHVREPLALHEDVAMKPACGELLVAGADRFENAGVLLQRLQQAVARAELDAAIGA